MQLQDELIVYRFTDCGHMIRNNKYNLKDNGIIGGQPVLKHFEGHMMSCYRLWYENNRVWLMYVKVNKTNLHFLGFLV